MKHIVQKLTSSREKIGKPTGFWCLRPLPPRYETCETGDSRSQCTSCRGANRASGKMKGSACDSTEGQFGGGCESFFARVTVGSWEHPRLAALMMYPNPFDKLLLNELFGGRTRLEEVGHWRRDFGGYISPTGSCFLPFAWVLWDERVFFCQALCYIIFTLETVHHGLTSLKL